MGEMADYMINGDDCQSCGQYIGDGDGYPRSCRGCDSEGEEILLSRIKEVMEVGLSHLCTASILLRESDRESKSKKLFNLINQISVFEKTLK